MKKWVLGLLFLAGMSTAAFAQGGNRKSSVSGTVIDGEDKSPVIQATIQVLSLPDSTMVTGNVTDLDGHFSIPVRPGKYVLKVSFVGYKTSWKQVTLTNAKPRVNTGEISLMADATLLEGVEIVAQAPEVTASEDTLVYNSSAYRVPEGSALEELVKKLPGAEVDENGKITINGKEIKKIMIDGKEFFADDPNIAMKNLPVNIIDKVRAYDKQSDMARVTGIDDGEEEAVLDLTVKKGMKKGWIGNLIAGYGSQDRYEGGVMISRFKDDASLSIIVSSNNTNNKCFSEFGDG